MSNGKSAVAAPMPRAASLTMQAFSYRRFRDVRTAWQRRGAMEVDESFLRDPAASLAGLRELTSAPVRPTMKIRDGIDSFGPAMRFSADGLCRYPRSIHAMGECSAFISTVTTRGEGKVPRIDCERDVVSVEGSRVRSALRIRQEQGRGTRCRSARASATPRSGR